MEKNKRDYKKEIQEMICMFVQKYQENPEITTKWGRPLVGYADANHPYIRELKSIISPAHKMPEEVLPDASIIIAYFVPFTKELAKINASYGRMASPEWARTYEETNAMFPKINEAVIAFLQQNGYQGATTPEATTFDQIKLISNWSHRHIAYTAGLGTFGMNNMLITRKGCCGRYFTIVTNLSVTPDEPLDKELCLYKKNKSCGVCFKNCPTQALLSTGYDRQKCYALLKENARLYTEFGSSYTDETGEKANSEGSEVCGKCITASPCMFWNLPSL